jgi:hypothetical protein
MAIMFMMTVMCIRPAKEHERRQMREPNVPVQRPSLDENSHPEDVFGDSSP